MKLAPLSVPYRALQKAGRLAITLVVLGSVGTGVGFGGALVAAGIGGAIALALAYEFAYYQRYQYTFTDDTFDIESGVLNRREREIPYGRVQNVDISRNVIQRLLGLSAINLETAGGGSTEAAIRYVTADAATTIQDEIRRRKRSDDQQRRTGTEAVDDAEGDTTGGDSEASDSAATREFDEPDEELLFEISASELALAGILSFDPRVPGLLFAVFTGSIPFVSPVVPEPAAVATTGLDPTLVLFVMGVVLLVGLVVLSWVVGAISAVVNYWGFRLTRSETELRYERGLLQRYSGTIPFEKIQTVTISDNPLKRRAGYATLAVETAGYAPGQANDRGSEAAVPIAGQDRIRRLAEEIDGCETGAFNRPPKRIRRRYLARYLIALAGVTGLLYAGSVVIDAAAGLPWYLPLVGVLLAPIAAHYKWLHRGYQLGADHFVTRNGVWNRETKRVPYHRLQTVIDSRTLFQRRWRVATVIGDTAGSLSLLGNDAAAVDIEVDDAVSLRSELRDRLQASLADRRRQRTGWSAAAQEKEQPGGTASTADANESTGGETNTTADDEPRRK
ncbi:PH domain-containing protein [Halonotius sp. GCM10025705]|uniref:PH domain-containing protein n=1 Tax=Halonotius sp. GCM10025705 TaxID=3252678 RepID=UPI00361468FF